ncbi:MAG: hypothetical protein HGA53_03120, partial [Anaerolineaceae bacterium]|nr:hypothetical protein [Anaerolineaceae bacterium]
GNVQQLTDGPAVGGSADLSPDGSTVAVFMGKEPDRQIYLEEAYGSQVRKLTTGVDNLGPTFSPDGQWLAFTSYGVGSDRHNKCKIYIMRVDGSEYRQLTHNKICDWLPNWGN